jgi:hypothetical protein
MARDIALKKGSKKAFNYFTSEFEGAMSEFIISMENGVSGKKRLNEYLYYSSPNSDPIIHIEYLEITENK